MFWIFGRSDKNPRQELARKEPSPGWSEGSRKTEQSPSPVRLRFGEEYMHTRDAFGKVNLNVSQTHHTGSSLAYYFSLEAITASECLGKVGTE